MAVPPTLIFPTPARPAASCPNRCKQQVRLTAGTVFQASKLPLTLLFAAVDHLTRGKGGISSAAASG